MYGPNIEGGGGRGCVGRAVLSDLQQVHTDSVRHEEKQTYP